MYEDEDNNGKFPGQSPVEVRYPRSEQEQQSDRERWPWLPGTTGQPHLGNLTFVSWESRQASPQRKP